MRWLFLFAVLPLGLGGCSDPDPDMRFENISWSGNHTIEPGNIWIDGMGEAIFTTRLLCDENVYAWYSTDEGTHGMLTATVLDGDGVQMVQEDYGDENRELRLTGAAGKWTLQIRSSPGFHGNALAYLECEEAPLQSL